MQLAIGAPLAGAVLAGVQYFDTHLWQAVVLSYIGAPLIGAYVIVMAPLLLQLLPRAGGLGERLGVLLAPFNLFSVLLAYVAAVVIDATGNYRLIWLFPAATGLAQATVNCWLKYPARNASSSDMVRRLWEWSIVQAESMAETGIVTGLLAAPLLGVVTKEDADSAVVIDMARNILGNPYEDDPSGPPGGPDGLAPGSAVTGQAPSDDGGEAGVTGVLQVGGGAVDGLPMGETKSGLGEPPPAGGTKGDDGSTGVPDTGRVAPSSGDGGTHRGVPDGGVGSSGPEEPDGGAPTGSDATGTDPGAD
jgi:hypothetical protein